MKYNHWLNSITSTSFTGVTEGTKDTLKDIVAKIDDAKFGFEIAEGRMEIFVKNKKIEKNAKDLKIKTLELHHLIHEKSLEILSLLHEIKYMKATTQVGQQTDKFKQLLEKQLDIIKDFHNKITSTYKEIAPLDYSLKNLIHEHLSELLKSGNESNYLS